MEKSLEQLKQEYEKTTVRSRKQRTHRLITRGAAIESIAPQTKELSEAEFYSLMESILKSAVGGAFHPVCRRKPRPYFRAGERR